MSGVSAPAACGREPSGSHAAPRQVWATSSSSSPSSLPDDDVARAAQPRCAVGDRVEHRLHVGRRAADDAQDLRRRRLLLQRLGDLGVARLQLLEQPHVLDRDHGLVGEGLQQLDLLVGERAHFRSANSDGADGSTLAQHRHRERRAPTACPATTGRTAAVLRAAPMALHVTVEYGSSGARGPCAADPRWLHGPDLDRFPARQRIDRAVSRNAYARRHPCDGRSVVRAAEPRGALSQSRRAPAAGRSASC